MASPARNELSASKAPVPSSVEPILSADPKSENPDPKSSPEPGLETNCEPETGLEESSEPETCEVADDVVAVDAAAGAG
ncbi:hypothetical protein SAY87_025650 [Trapa incisa]|uniref:Uncharacterized protein n=1 Tax=Trapa incisa TaxID=236973 RepID=A0AAN7GTQ5_9MYRT|nr:hypothetical protein SAY87_025650 [Trapa incisa]